VDVDPAGAACGDEPDLRDGGGRLERARDGRRRPLRGRGGLRGRWCLRGRMVAARARELSADEREQDRDRESREPKVAPCSSPPNPDGRRGLRLFLLRKAAVVLVDEPLRVEPEVVRGRCGGIPSRRPSRGGCRTAPPRAPSGSAPGSESPVRRRPARASGESAPHEGCCRSRTGATPDGGTNSVAPDAPVRQGLAFADVRDLCVSEPDEVVGREANRFLV
jgi:hypothetical protein